VTASLRIEKLQRSHAVEEFSCGDAALDRFLVRFALQAPQANSSQTYVGVSGTNIIGFYTLVVGEVRHSDAPARLVKGMPRHPIPLMVLARLAVQTQWRGRGIGGGLLLDALGRTLQVARYRRRASARRSRQGRGCQVLLPTFRFCAVAHRRSASLHVGDGHASRRETVRDIRSVNTRCELRTGSCARVFRRKPQPGSCRAFR
jgi:hypothetical protein